MLATPTLPHSHFAQPFPVGAMPLPVAPRAVPVVRSATLPPVPFHPAQAQSRASGMVVLQPKPQPQVIQPLPAHASPAHVLPISHTASSSVHHSSPHHSPASAHLQTPQVLPVPTPRVPHEGGHRSSHRAPGMAHASSMSALRHSSQPHHLPIPPVNQLAVQTPSASSNSSLHSIPPPLLIPLPPIPAPTNNVVPIAQPRPTSLSLSIPHSTTSYIPATNNVPLTPTSLTHILNTLSDLLLPHFGHQVRLLVHGGVVAVLHKDLQHRRETRDVDYVHRYVECFYSFEGCPRTRNPISILYMSQSDRFAGHSRTTTAPHAGDMRETYSETQYRRRHVDVGLEPTG